MFYDFFCLDSLFPEIVFQSQRRTKSDSAVIRAYQIQPECSGPWRTSWLCLLAKYSELRAATSLCSLFLKNRSEDKRKAMWAFQRWIWVNISPLSAEHPALEVFSSATANAEKSVCLVTCECEFIYKKQHSCPCLLGRVTGLMCLCIIWGPSWCSSRHISLESVCQQIQERDSSHLTYMEVA